MAERGCGGCGGCGGEVSKSRHAPAGTANLLALFVATVMSGELGAFLTAGAVEAAGLTI